MTGRAIAFLVVGIIITSAIIMTNIEAASSRIVDNFGVIYLKQSAANLAQTGVSMGLRQLANDASWRTGIPLMNLFNGKLVVSAADSSWSGGPAVRIVSVGIMDYGQTTEKRDTVIAWVRIGSYGPISVKSVIETNASTKVGGGLDIDGRDHDLSGNLIPDNGVLAIYTTSTYSHSGSGKVDGTTELGIDNPVKAKSDTSIIRDNQTYPGGFPASPDAVAGGLSNGYPEGTLKSLAQSGVAGGQYSADGSTLTYPLNGVTYVELAPNATWSPKLSGSGILVVHNATGTARFKAPAGTFTGLIITDDITTLSGLIMTGAIVQISPTPTSDQIGTSNGSVTFCRQAISNAVNLLNSGGSTSSSVNVVAWWE